MRVHRVLLIATVATLVAAYASDARAQSCDRACLTQTLDRYLAAMVKHDPKAAPLDRSFRYTENAVEVHPGDGLWKTVTALGLVQRKYADPVTGQAAYFGLIEEGADTNITTIRVKVVNHAITEGEAVIARTPISPFSPQGLIDNAPPGPPSSRTPREQMVAAAQSYFEGVHRKDGSAILAQPGCPRIENGVMLAGPNAARSPGSGNAGTADCASGMQGYTQIAGVVSRRFPLVDEQAGVVLGMAVFTRPPGATRADGTPWKRNLLTEIFAIENGRIRAIYAAMHYLDEGVPAPGWPTP